MQQQTADQHVNDRPEADQWTPFHGHLHGLEPQSYTDQKLRHASGHHLHMTSRRSFIGPIPKGWLQNHRRAWFRSGLRFKNYSSKAVTFSADTIAPPTENPEANNPPSSIQEEALADATVDLETDTENANDTSEQEAAQSSSEPVRILSQPMAEGDVLRTPATTYTGASTNPNRDDRSEMSANHPKDAASYFTAREYGSSIAGASQPSSPNVRRTDLKPLSKMETNTLSVTSHNGPNQTSPVVSASETESTTALLKHKRWSQVKGKQSAALSASLEHHEPQTEEARGEEGSSGGERQAGQNSLFPFSSRMGKYNLDDNLLDKQQRLQARIATTYGTVSKRLPRGKRIQNGAILKAENMLVRVEETMQKDLPEDYTENDSLRMETRVTDKWREFLVVCRKTSDEDAPFLLQMYRTRVIPEVQKEGSKITPHHKVSLGRKNSRVNLYSTLDKTIAIWGPCKIGTKIYILRPRSTAHSVEWYTLLCQIMGWHRPSSLPINVPDLGVSLILKNPFVHLEKNVNAKDRQGQDHTKLDWRISDEQHAAASIIRCCMEMLEQRPEWSEVLQKWSKTEKMGLAWKRYDRLEWVFGVNEEKMYGSMVMQTTHELELRPRHHYATSVKHDGGVHGRKQEEPQPVEGFLVRLTSQKGVHQRMNKMFFKRLYFFTQDQYLLFCKPSNALPPTPPKLSQLDDENMPSPQQILDQMPLSYDIDPFPIQDGEISWLSGGNKEHIKKNDEYAYAQFRRNLHNLSQADGFVDLCRVQEVRLVQRGSSPADPNIDGGPAVDFHPEPRDTNRDDGATGQFDDDRTFEMLLDNGLVIRLQAYNSATRDLWVKELGALVEYWKARAAADAAELKAVRQRNLEILGVDEEMESLIGQFARKWEVTRTEASPHLHNMCALSGCRPIKMSGQLYRKPRRHTTFKRCSVILTAGQLLIFRSSLRRRNGVEIPQIHQELETSVDLENCYIYSGLLTDDDVLYGNQTFDSNRPGRHALQRVYLSTDQYTSSDEDTAVTFVIWQPLKRNYFRAREAGEKGKVKQTLKQVSTLGVHGRTAVFKARSRVERDIWVSSIASEIDRLQEERKNDIRVIQ